MKIVMVTPRFKPAIGGAEESVYQLAKGMIKRGHEAIVYTSDLLKTFPRYEYLDEKRMNYNGIPVERFHALRLFKNYPIIPMFTPSLLREKTDIIHANVFGCFSSDASALVSAVRKIPFVLSTHGYLGASPNVHPLTHMYIRSSKINTLRIARKIICNSKTETEPYRRLVGPSKIEIIPNGIDLDYWRKLPKKRSFRDKYDINGYLIISIGRFIFRKGFQYLIQAFTRVLDRFPNATLAIAGSDFGYLNELKKLAHRLKINQRIIFIANLSGWEIKELYVDSDLMAIPSIYGEGSPIVVLEAMACGKPIVASRVGGLCDILKSGINGLLVTPKNPAELAQGIITLIKNEELCQKMGNLNKHEVTKYSWDRVVEKTEDFYYKVLES